MAPYALYYRSQVIEYFLREYIILNYLYQQNIKTNHHKKYQKTKKWKTNERKKENNYNKS